MKNFLKISIFTLITIILIFGTICVLTPNDPTWEYFYKEKEDSIDVLMLGSSNIYSNINPAILWRDYGIASYDLCGSGQPIWNSYYYLKEAYKTQSPKIVVVDILGASFNTDYVDTPTALLNTVGIRSLENRYDAVKASFTPDLVLDVMLNLPAYHERLKEYDGDLSKFIYGDDNNSSLAKGFHPVFFYSPVEPTKMTKNFEVKYEVNPKNMEYLHKITELAKENGSKILLIKTPGNFSDYAYGCFNTVVEWANNNNIDILNMNYNYDEIGFDFSTDLADIVHFTPSGVEKISSYLGDYINKNYIIPNHKGESEYESYDEYLNHYNESKFKCPAILDKELVYSLNENCTIPATKELNVFQDIFKVEKNTYYQTIIEFNSSAENTMFLYDFYNEAGYDSIDQEQLATITEGKNTLNIVFNTKNCPEEVYYRILSNFKSEITLTSLNIYKLTVSGD